MFRFSKVQEDEYHERCKILKNVPLAVEAADGRVKMEIKDISNLISCFKKDGDLFHLHDELVDKGKIDDKFIGGANISESVQLCKTCFDAHICASKQQVKSSDSLFIQFQQ